MNDTIKKAREKAGLSRKEFCEIFKVPYRTLQNWENNVSECPEYVRNLIIEKLEMLQNAKQK